MKKIALTALIVGISMSIIGCSNNPKTVSEPQNNNKTNKISIEEAKDIALKHSNLTIDKAEFIRAEGEIDNGVDTYHIEFYHENKEYDYEINANDGTIIEYDYDVENYDIAKGNIESNIETKLTVEQVKEIAIKHANLTSDKVKFGKVELDNDNGVVKYDVEFFHNNVEYDYEVDANTGEIISFEKK